MIKIICNSCSKEIDKEHSNKVRVSNIYNRSVTLHYCFTCAVNKFPDLRSMLSWTHNSFQESGD